MAVDDGQSETSATNNEKLRPGEFNNDMSYWGQEEVWVIVSNLTKEFI